MEKADIKTNDPQKKETWSLQKKIVVAIVGIAIIVLAAVLVAKFVFNFDLLNLSSYAMSWQRRMR